MRVRPAHLGVVLGALGSAGVTGCASVFGIEEGVLRPIVEVSGSIGKDTTWYADQTTILTGFVVVEAGATLTIEPGTKILAQMEGGLLVKPGARIVARGTKVAPIVFTSAASERAEGDWRGVILCGRAPINGAPGGMRPMDVLPPGIQATCGGTAEDDDSGVFEFVRIEFAGRNKDLPGSPGGFRLEGVGSGTVVDHVQVHRTESDAMDLRGGTVSVKHILVTMYEDDGFDWALGWRGKGQFIGVVMGNMQGDTGIQAGQGTSDAEIDGAGSAPSDPLLYNVTLIGMEDQYGPNIKLRGGTRGRMFDMLVARAGTSGLGIEEAPAQKNANEGLLDIRHSIFANDDNFVDEPNFSASDWAMDPARNNRDLSASESGLPLFTNGAIYLSLVTGAEALSGAVAPPDDGFFDPSALFVGACGPVCPDFEGWTAFPDR
ncbi:hypothetical protein [Polyangium sorediatum]|uniref:Lipoprotein n=1 Tax=Polyangium sorediatum TaxID=889274 RepID=A0ABT6P5P5_9BACT|nr:hypothetical protein [Polyangium sorediatum]MDI1435927.1 hypothetical protein [Polyangium sorediatum]